MKASVIVATSGRREVLLNTLESLLQVGCEGNEDELEVLVVEQPPYQFSLDEIRHWKKLRPHCRWIRMEKANLPQARNVGILKSSGEVIIFVDDDMRFEKGFVQAHLLSLQSQNVGVVAGRLINERFRDFWEKFWSKQPPFFSRFSGTLYGGFDMKNGPSPICTAQGGNMSVLRKAIVAAGGFDPSFEKVALREEADALERIKRLGYEILYEPRALARHLRASEGGERLKDPSELMYWSRRSESYFVAKNFPTWLWYGFLVRSCVAAGLRGLMRFEFFKFLKQSLLGTLSGRKIAVQNPGRLDFITKAKETEKVLEIK